MGRLLWVIGVGPVELHMSSQEGGRRVKGRGTCDRGSRVRKGDMMIGAERETKMEREIGRCCAVAFRTEESGPSPGEGNKSSPRASRKKVAL